MNIDLRCQLQLGVSSAIARRGTYFKCHPVIQECDNRNSEKQLGICSLEALLLVDQDTIRATVRLTPRLLSKNSSSCIRAHYFDASLQVYVQQDLGNWKFHIQFAASTSYLESIA